MRELQTTGEVVDALGGNTVVAELLGCASPNVVSNWRKGLFPGWTILVLNLALLKIGMTAPAALWNVKQPQGSTA